MQGKCNDKEIEDLAESIRVHEGFLKHQWVDLAEWLIEKGYSRHPASELVPLDNIDKLSHTIKFYSKNYLQVDFSTYGAQKLAEYIALEYGHPKPHSCKCSNNEGARTVRKIDDGLCACPRCGGIVITKQNVPSVESIMKILNKWDSDKGVPIIWKEDLASQIHNLLVKGEDSDKSEREYYQQ